MPSGDLGVTLAASALSSHIEQSGNIVYAVLGDATLASSGVVLLYGALSAVLGNATSAGAIAIEASASLDVTLGSVITETFSAIFGGTDAPYEDVISWTGHPLTGSLVRVRTGNLFGIFGEPNEFGLFAGEGWDASSGDPPSSSSQYIRLGSITNEFHNVPINLYDTGVLTMQMEPDAPSFAMGNPLPSAYDTGVGLWQGKDCDDIYKWRIGDPSASGSNLSWNGSVLSLVNSSLDISGENAHIAFGNPPPTSPTSGTGIWIDRTGLYGVNAGVTQIFIDTLDGVLYVDGGTEFGVNPLLGDLYVDGILTLGTDGRLQQGTGTWGVDFTGSAIWNDTGIMNIGGWDNNVKQWWGGSDGKFYTGGGNVTMDANGIAISSTSSYLDPDAAITFKYSGQTYYTISGENGYLAYNVLSIPSGSAYAPSYRTFITNENPNANYWLQVSEGNKTYKYGSSKLEIDLNTGSKSLDLLMKAYDSGTVSRAQGRLYYYSVLDKGYNTVTLSSECQDPTEGTKTASILLRTASYYAEVSSRIDITTDDVNIISNLAITGITTTTGGVHVGGTSDPGTGNLVVDGTIKDGDGVEYLKTGKTPIQIPLTSWALASQVGLATLDPTGHPIYSIYFNDAQTGILDTTIMLPSDMSASNIYFTCMLYPGTASGNVVTTVQMRLARSGEAYPTKVTASSSLTTTLTAGKFTRISFALNGALFTGDDVIGVRYYRSGTDVNDTLNATLYMVGSMIRFA